MNFDSSPAPDANRPDAAPFLSDLSHEFKTPIHVILSALQLLRLKLEREENAHLAEYLQLLDYAQENSYRLLRLAANLTDLSVQGSLDRLQAANWELSELIQELTGSVRPYAQARRLSLRVVNRADRGTLICCDRDKLDRILLNLLSNAMKFTAPGGRITVTITAGADCCRISVRDSGCGIPAEFLPHLFERFRTREPERCPGASGSGLGLAIVQQLVALHGGTVSVHSREGEGSTFTVCLPLRQEESGSVLRTEPLLEAEALAARVRLELSDLPSAPPKQAGSHPATENSL